MIQDVARDFAEKELRPIAAAIDRAASFPRETVPPHGRARVMGIFIPEAWGGSGGRCRSYTVAVEEVSRGWPLNRRHHVD